jgi:hypothetical protein
MQLVHGMHVIAGWVVALGALSLVPFACTSANERPSPIDASPNDAAYACTSRDDCAIYVGTEPGPAVFCCISHMCILGQAALDTTCDDPDAQVISASSYDRSCQNDSDCVSVPVGNFCFPGADTCPSAAISQSAYAHYQADVAKTQASVCGGFSGCPNIPGPCCAGGVCQAGAACVSSVGGPDAGAD